MPQYLKLLFILILILGPGVKRIFAQDCACPPASTCKPCTGGYTSITLRYNGAISAVVVIVDGKTTLADLTVSPFEEFTIRGSKRNEKFADKAVPVLVNGLANTLLGSSCGDLQVGLSYGAFTVMAAESIGGNIVCCTTPPRDLLAPLLSGISSPITIEATTGCGGQVSWSEPIVSDDCTEVTLTSSHTSGEVFPVGTTTVVFTAQDKAGNVSSSSFTVTVTDRTPPVFTGGPTRDIILDATESCSALAAWNEPTLTDACSTTLTRSHKPNTAFPVGQTKVQYEARDASGNTSFFSFNVIVNDRTKPEFTSFPSDITVAAGMDCSAIVTWPAPTVQDECSAVILTSSHQPNASFPSGTTKVRFVATDNSGNATERELTIKVEDKNPVQFLNCPSNKKITVDENILTAISWTEPLLSTSCEKVTVKSNYRPDDLFPLGTTTVKYEASTASGKAASCKFDVIITLEEKPLKVSRLITPDGDGLNDEWILVNIEDYRENQVVVFDRWGGIIYQASRYDNESVVWKGTNKAGVSVPTGTYFYTIIAHNGRQRIQESGAIELVR